MHRSESTPKPLPSTLSGLLRAAVEDARAIERDDRYALEMSSWHSAAEEDDDDDKRCLVCMAGCLIARRLGFGPEQDVSPSDLDEETRERLCAVDSMRMGEFGDASGYLAIDVPPDVANACWDLVYPEYDASDNCHATWDTYLKCADLLEAAGL